MAGVLDPRRVDCPLCGPRAARPWTRDRGFTVVRCAGCGLRITWPPPDAATLAAAYAGDYYEARDMGPLPDGAAAERARGILGRAGMVPTRVLDFGAGQGELVRSFRALGIEADGVEPGPGGRAQARALHGIDLHESTATLPARAYDCVTLVHSLEHVPQPVETLRALRPLLAPGGLVFVEVPHAGSVVRLRGARRSAVLDLPVHLYHFEPETLAAVAHCAGFAVKDVVLTNPDLLEWALGLRHRWQQRGQTEPAAAPSAPAAFHPGPPPPRPSGLWAAGLLPWIRRRFPGWKFQALLRPLDDARD